MAIYRPGSAGTKITTNTGASIAAGVTANAGEVIINVLTTRNATATITTLNGWTILDSVSFTNGMVWLLGRTAAGAESSWSSAIVSSSSQQQQQVQGVYQGVEIPGTIDGTNSVSGTGSTSPQTISAMSGGVDRGAAVGVLAMSRGATTTWATWTEDTDVNTGTGTTNSTLASGHVILTANGNTPTASVTESTAGNAGWCAVVLPFLPPAGPDPVEVVESSWTTATSPLTTVHPGAQDGDHILVVAFGDGGLASGNGVSAVTTTNTAGTTEFGAGAWTEVEEFLPTGARGWTHVAYAEVTATGSVTTSTARTQAGTARTWGKYSILLRNAGAVGDHTKTTTGAAENASLTVEQDSLVAFGAYDYDAVTISTGFTPSGAVEIERATDATNGSRMAAYWVDQAAGTTSYGGNDTSASTNIDLVLVEILKAAGAAPEGLPIVTMAPRIAP